MKLLGAATSMLTKKSPCALGDYRPPYCRRSDENDPLPRIAEIVQEQGFLHLTMDDLSRQLRCSKSTLYSHIPSKQLLGPIVSRLLFRKIRQHLTSTFAEKLGPTERLAEFVVISILHWQRTSTTFREQLASTAATARIYEAGLRHATMYLEKVFAAGISEGTFRSVHPTFAATAVVRLVADPGSRPLSEHDPVIASKRVETLLDFVIHSVLNTTSGTDTVNYWTRQFTSLHCHSLET